MTSPSQTVPRKFPNFLTAFEFFGKDNFTPPTFNTWVGLSIIAGALERKVWLEWNQSLRYYPNLYVMLVALPGAGKSTAINRGVELLEELYKENRLINFLPTQVTEAKLIELMGQKATFYFQGKPFNHCSAYYFASEASDSFKEIYGDITSTMTNFYDCPAFWEKATKKDGRLTIENACFNLLAGSTLQYLGELVNESNVMGGFASRINYIISREFHVRQNTFPVSLAEVDAMKQAYKADLVHDLKRINEMIGPFCTTAEFREAWQVWDYELQQKRQEMSSEKMQSLLVRQGTSMHKLCMVLSAAESSDMIMKLHHFEKAKELLDDTERQLPTIFREARANSTGTADGLKHALLLALGSPLTRNELSRRLTLRGFDPGRVDGSISSFITNKTIEPQSDGRLKLLVDPDQYL
jgi:hypothetical protein